MAISKGNYPEGERLPREALAINRVWFSNNSTNVVNSLNALAASLQAQNMLADAEAAICEALGIETKLEGDGNPALANFQNTLAWVLVRRDKLTEAEPLFRRALEARERTLGKEHPETLQSVNNLGCLLKQKGDYAGAEPLLRQALEWRERTLGKDHPATLQSVDNLARILYLKDQFAEAESLFRRVVKAQERTLGNRHPDLGESVNNLAACLMRQGKLAEGTEMIRQSMRVKFGSGGEDGQSREKAMAAISQAIEKDPYVGYVLFRAFVYGQQGQWQAAVTDLSQVAKTNVLWSLGLGPLLVEIGDTNGYNRRRSIVSVTTWGEDPETVAQAAMEMSLRPSDRSWSVPAQLAETAVTRGTNHARMPRFQLVKGLVEYRQGHYAGAQDWAQKSLARSGTNYTTAVAAGAVVAMAQHQLKQPDEARKVLAQAVELSETKLPKQESGDLEENWPEWLTARILLREAKGVGEAK